MKDDDRDWFEGHQVITDATCSHFQQIFTGEEKHINEDVLNCILDMATQNKNETL